MKGVTGLEAKERALDWLEIMGLSEYAEMKLEKLSKGMQQKVQFIATVLHRPPLILLDEPFSGLDPINQDFFKELIKKLQEEGTTILLSAHQMGLVEELCTRIFLIHQGEKILYGTVQDIKEDYHEYSIDMDFSRGENLKHYLESMAEIRNLKVSDGHADFRISSDLEINAFIKDLTSHCRLEKISVQKPPLHEIFVNTVRERGGKE